MDYYVNQIIPFNGVTFSLNLDLTSIDNLEGNWYVKLTLSPTGGYANTDTCWLQSGQTVYVKDR